MYTIYQDLDGCLADFVQGINNEIHRLIRTDQSHLTKSQRKHVKNFLKNFSESQNITQEVLKHKAVRPFMYHIASKPGFFSSLPRMQNNLWDIVKNLSTNSKVTNFEFLTAPIGQYAIEDKTKWVRNVLNSNAKVNVVERNTKINFCTNQHCILIDDYLKTIEEWNSCGGIGLHFTGNTVEIKNKLHSILS